MADNKTTPSRARKPKPVDSTGILRTALEEQRRFHDELHTSFYSVKNKIIYFTGTILAILTFLYSGAMDDTKTIQERLFIPDELYGIVFYVGGLFAIFYALVILLQGARPNAQWHYPTDVIEEEVLNRVNKEMSEEQFLQRVVDNYETYHASNLKTHETKSSAVKNSFFPLLIGATILVVLRFFQ